jgi:hypothetical protein
VLDLVLQMLEMLCDAGECEKAEAKAHAMIFPGWNRPLYSDELPVVLSAPHLCILYLHYIHLFAFKQFPNTDTATRSRYRFMCSVNYGV